MRLDVDLAFDAVPGRSLGEGDPRALDLHAIAATARSPARLRRLLRDRDYEEVRVRTGQLPLSALQAAALASLVLVRAPRYVVNGRRLSRVAFAAYAIGRASIAAPSELARTGLLVVRIRRAAERAYRLPRSRPRPASALYLRVDPTLKWLGSQVGGAATHTAGVVNGLLANGVDVKVLAAERPEGTDDARFQEVPVRRVLHLARGLTYTDFSAAVIRAGHGQRADFVYQRYQLGGYAGLELARRLDVPLVLEFNGSEIWVERHWGSGKLRFAAELERLEWRNLHDASLVVVVSAALRDFVVERGVDADRVVVNPNGVDYERLAPYRREPAVAWRQRLGLPQVPTVGFIGTFGPWHGVQLLPEIAANIPGARFLFIGDGALLGEVREAIERRGLTERTILPGVLEHGRALEMLAACDICLSPHVPNPDGTPFFGSPTKLFEYMGLGKAIVAADLDQIGEVIENERNGLLHPPGSATAAATAVRRLLSDDALRERLSAAALDDALRVYSWRAHVKRIVDRLSQTG